MRDHFSSFEYEDSKKVRDVYSTDASIFSVVPEGVVFPKSAIDISKIVKKISEENISTSLTVRAAGTCMSGGPLNEGIIVDTTRYMNAAMGVDVNHKTITVEGGAMYKEIENLATPHNLMFPPYTSSKDVCVIGGMIGNNASGELSVRYGATIDWIKSLDVVLSDGNVYSFKELTKEEWLEKQKLQNFEGEIYRKMAHILDMHEHLFETKVPKVSKNAAGYQLWKIYNPKTKTYNLSRLFTASQGTLGIITSATLKLAEIPPHRRMVVCALTDIKIIGEVLHALKNVNPESIETFDVHTYTLAKTYYPKEASLVSFVSDTAIMTLFIQVAEDTDEACRIRQKDVVDILHKHNITAHIPENKETIDAFFTIRRASFRMLKDLKSAESRVAPCIEDTIVPVERYGEFLTRLKPILDDYTLTYTYAGHIGDGSIRLVPLANFDDPKTPEMLLELSHRVYDLTIELGGSISVDHNDGLLKTHYLEKQYGKGLVEMFKELKDFFDPKNIFNPGKKVPTEKQGGEEYAKKHMHTKNT